MGRTRRYTARAWVPLGLHREALIEALESATWGLYRTKKADAVAVFFYREGVDADPERIGIFTVAKVTIAPDGQWERAGTGDEPMPNTEIRDSYFEPIKTALADGATAFLVSDDNESDVALCATAKLEQDTATRVPHNTPVTVRRSERISMGTEDVIAYEVSTEDGRRGWVHGWRLSSDPGPRPRSKLQPADPNRSVTCDRFEISHTVEGDRLSVTIETDLPGSTVFILSVDRAYMQRDKTSTYPLPYYNGRITVGELRGGVQVDISDSVFRAKLNERVSLHRRIGEPIDVAGVQPEIKIQATVGGNTFGQQNENLVGAAVTELRSGRRIVESNRAIHRPMR